MNNNTNADVIQLLYRAKKRMSISEQARQQFQYDTIVQQAQGFYSMEKWDLINEQGYTRQTQKHIYIYYFPNGTIMKYAGNRMGTQWNVSARVLHRQNMGYKPNVTQHQQYACLMYTQTGEI